MSYGISLVDPVTKDTLNLDTPHQIKGGTYALGGITEMWLNITYNYGQWYYKKDVFPNKDGIRSIYGKTGLESIPILKHAIDKLETMKIDLSPEKIKEYESQDVTGYWLPTRENAIKPLYSLLTFAQARPDGIWMGD